ncbi:hypothetical protein [Caenispirillum salinarum]|uniref:hypothetical protein n=1 Tax=Caenispirillum salinarum TaxID=859058 RepID=UPI00384B5F5D
MNIFKLLGVGATALALGACSSIVEGTSQNVSVMTDPSGASCTLSSPNGVLGIVNPTPGSIEVPKSKHNISVACEKEGFQNGAGVLASSFEAMTIGNVIFGGLIGVAIDAGSGAMNKYPATVTVLLAPESFPSVDARDAFFDGLIATRATEADALIAAVKAECASPSETCEARVTAVQKALEADLAELERKRAATLVDSSGA